MKTQAQTAPTAGELFMKGVALGQAGKLEEAIVAYHEALRVDANYHPAWMNLATALRTQGLFEASVACSGRALFLSPQNPVYLMNHGNGLSSLDRLDEALEMHSLARRLKPDEFLIQRNYAVILRELGRLDDALAAVKEAQRIWPADIRLLWEEAIIRLQMGDFKNGWEAFDIRWKLPGMVERRSKVATRWRGEDLAGKTVLVYEEQGFGDSILCSRYIPLIAAMGGKIILECKPALHRLFANLPGVVKIAEPGKTLAGFDYHVPMMSLPGVFKTNLSHMPAPAALTPAPGLSPEVLQKLALGKNHLKVGIFWSGSPDFKSNNKRAVPFARFLPLTEIPAVQLYSLQMGDAAKELFDAGADGLVIDLAPHIKDFADTAAMARHLDLIIMTDSAVAHLASSLGVPVWNLLSFAPYWIYLNKGDKTPWYPSMRLFRQPKPGDWDSVFKEVAAALKKTAAK